MSFVYVFVVNYKYAKIGITNNLVARRASIQTAHPHEVEIETFAWMGDLAKSLESAFHTHYDADRINREWFYFTQRVRGIADHVEKITDFDDRKETVRYIEWLRENPIGLRERTYPYPKEGSDEYAFWLHDPGSSAQ